MTRRADPLWRLLADRPGTAGTLADWRDLLGDALELVQPLLVPTGAYASAWACGDRGREGCRRRVVDHGRDLVAVCGEQPRECERVQLRREDLVLYALDPKRLGRALLKGVVDAERKAEPLGGGWLLGVARFGETEVVFHLGFHADAGTLLGVHAALQERLPSRPAVLLVPVANQVEPNIRAALRGRDALLLSLDEAMLGDDTLGIDLADVIAHFRFDGVDLGAHLAHRYDLILDPLGGRYWLYGKRLKFKSRARNPQRLLVALAKVPGSLVTRATLFGEVWPDEYGRRDVDKNWGRSLRDQVKALKVAMGVDKETYPISARSSGDDAEGGYLLRIDRRRVCWWTEPLD